MTVGDLSLFINFIDLLTESTLFAGGIIFQYVQSSISFRRYGIVAQTNDYESLVCQAKNLSELYYSEHRDRLEEYTNDDVNTQNGETDTALISLDDLCFNYPQSERGISNINCDFSEGSFTVITGPIGSGKTTLLRAILGLVACDSGSISVRGRRIDKPAECFTPPFSSYIPQIPVLISASIFDNVNLGKGYTSTEVIDALSLADLNADLGTMPNGLETAVGNRGYKLSGGQIQRVALARALVDCSKVIVMDDLSSALDVHTEFAIWQSLASQDATFLVVSHRKSTFLRATKIIVMDNGSITAIGTAEELLRSSEIFRSLWKDEDSA
jgi:ATP-binding cassette subfamily B protein